MLLAEDEILIRMDVADALREAGIEVVEVGTADDAIALLKSSLAVDLILTDINMPGTADGIALASYVARERPGLRVAAMSGHLVATSETEPLFVRIFRKPLLSYILAQSVAEMLKLDCQQKR